MNHLLKAKTLFQQGDLNGAESALAKVLRAHPKHFDSLHLYGIVLALNAKWDEASRYLKKALSIAPGNVGVIRDLGKVQFEIGRYADALDSFRKIQNLVGNQADVLTDIGTVLGKLGKFEDAMKSYDDALALNANYADAWLKRGHLLRQQRRFGEALEALDRVVAIAPGNLDGWLDRSDVLFDQQNYAAALNSAEQAIALHPACVDAWLNKCLSLHFLERSDEAMAAYDQLFLLDSRHAGAWANLSKLQMHIGQFDQALSSLEKARALSDTPHEHSFSESIIRLLRGQFASGWPLYESRKYISGAKPMRHQHIAPLTHASQVDGKAVLVWHEQGLGDTLQFSRLVPMLAARGAQVTFEVQSVLQALLMQMGNGVSVVASAEAGNRNFDYQIPLLSLPLIFDIGLDTIPPPRAAVSISSETKAKWQAIVGASVKPKIGIACSGNQKNIFDAKRNAPLAVFTNLCDIADIYLIQTHVREADRAALEQSRIVFLGPHLIDFEDTAAAVESMDLIVSVDTSLAHLAGAMAKPVWTLLPFVPEWRWLLNRDDSPWYPSMKLFRQSTPGDWSGVLSKVKSALEAPA
ncbi:MAG: repeat protein [Herbaspirillum sp.]|jgi:tetratricopeptide (TPR) repeat protein|nr:repeat protein [Herbaspirillum sp.]